MIRLDVLNEDFSKLIVTPRLLKRFLARLVSLVSLVSDVSVDKLLSI